MALGTTLRENQTVSRKKHMALTECPFFHNTFLTFRLFDDLLTRRLMIQIKNKMSDLRTKRIENQTKGRQPLRY